MAISINNKQPKETPAPSEDDMLYNFGMPFIEMPFTRRQFTVAQMRDKQQMIEHLRERLHNLEIRMREAKTATELINMREQYRVIDNFFRECNDIYQLQWNQ